MRGMRSANAGSDSTSVRLSAREPWLPPKSSRVGAESEARAGNLEELAPHRDARDFAVLEPAAGLLEVNRGGLGHGSNHAIGEAGNDIGFEDRATAVPRRAAASMAGPEAYPPTPMTTSGRKSAMMLQAAAMAVGRAVSGLEAGGQADAVELADIDQAQPKTGLRHQAGFDSALGADEDDVGAVAVPELLGDGDGGDYVATGAAAGKNCTHDSVRSECYQRG